MEENLSRKPGRIFYNLEMAKQVRTIKKPFKQLVVDIMARPNYLALVVYEDQIMGLDDSKREQIMEYLKTVRELIQSFGVRCEMEGAKGKPRNNA
jgi:hypothetical protein